MDDYPPYNEMVVAAIADLKERSGSSRQAIAKYLAANYNVPLDRYEIYMKQALKRLVKKKTLVQTKGAGASGSFKINPAYQKKHTKAVTDSVDASKKDETESTEPSTSAVDEEGKGEKNEKMKKFKSDNAAEMSAGEETSGDNGKPTKGKGGVKKVKFQGKTRKAMKDQKNASKDTVDEVSADEKEESHSETKTNKRRAPSRKKPKK